MIFKINIHYDRLQIENKKINIVKTVCKFLVSGSVVRWLAGTAA